MSHFFGYLGFLLGGGFTLRRIRNTRRYGSTPPLSSYLPRSRKRR